MMSTSKPASGPKTAAIFNHRAPTPEPVEDPDPGKTHPEPEEEPVPDHNPSGHP
jgi:hypothetical protein